jgi:dolichyl-phosphate-mannose--protein O-mannosyl transferase
MDPFGFMLAMVLAYCAWSALAIGMDRHYADIHGRGAEPPAAMRRRMRRLGTLGIALTFAVAVRMQGWTIGPVGCLGFLTMAGVLQVLSLTYVPARVPVWSRRLLYSAPVWAALWLLDMAA